MAKKSIRPRSPRRLYALKSPEGEIQTGTISQSRNLAWGEGLWITAFDDFETTAAARKAGWTCVEVDVREVKK